MIITKLFSAESAHIVRNCTSHRCSHSIHGHSAKIELSLECNQLDNAGMVYDFGLMKGTIKELIDSMDHCYIICQYDDPEFIEFIQKNCDRWIMLPFNPSAELLSMFVHRFSQIITDNTNVNNGEGKVGVYSVKYWETATGSATSHQWDLDDLWNPLWETQIRFSDGVIKDWSKDLKDIIFNGKAVTNPKIKQQIKIG